MIKIITTVHSIEQAEKLLIEGVDELYFGEDYFGLRLPTSFTRDEQKTLVEMAHNAGKKVSIALNAILHNEHIEKLPEYLRFLKEINVDSVTLGDPGAIQVMKNENLFIPFRYDAQVVVTNSRQLNFFAKKGAIEAVVAREVPKMELKNLIKNANIPVEVLVYGTTCIQHSRRPLLENYFNYVKKYDKFGKERGFFISDPNDNSTHYSIYQDINGTHIFANNDISLANNLIDLVEIGAFTWKLDGLFTDEVKFTEIVKLFINAKWEILSRQWNKEKGNILSLNVKKLHPINRNIDTGFFLIDPKIIK